MALERPKIGGAGILAERRLVQRLGGRLMPGSGSSSGRGGGKGDANLDDQEVKFKLEAKTTVNDSISLKLSWLQKITGEAFHTGREPALSIQFVFGDGRPKPGGSWVMIPEALYREKFCGGDE